MKWKYFIILNLKQIFIFIKIIIIKIIAFLSFFTDVLFNFYNYFQIIIAYSLFFPIVNLRLYFCHPKYSNFTIDL